MFTLINLSELSATNLSRVPLQTVHELAILPVEHPDQQVLSSCDEDITLRMPFEEVQVLRWAILKSTLQGEVSLSVPYADLIVHASRGHQLAIVVELDEFHSLRMTRQAFVKHGLKFHLGWLHIFALLDFFLPYRLIVLNDFPNEGLVFTVSRYEGIVWLPWEICDTVHRVLVSMLPRELDNRMIGDKLLRENLALIILLSIFDFTLVDGLELVWVIFEPDVILVHGLDLVLIQIDEVIFIGLRDAVLV